MDWDGGNLVYEYDFEEQGIPPDELEILGTFLNKNVLKFNLHCVL